MVGSRILGVGVEVAQTEELECAGRLTIPRCGGDPVLLNDIFGVPEYDPLHRAASYIDGAMSILTGIAANRSIATGMPVNIEDLVRF